MLNTSPGHPQRGRLPQMRLTRLFPSDAGDPSLTVTEGDEVTVLCDLRPGDLARVTWERSGQPADGTQLDNGGIRSVPLGETLPGVTRQCGRRLLYLCFLVCLWFPRFFLNSLYRCRRRR